MCSKIQRNVIIKMVLSVCMSSLLCSCNAYRFARVAPKDEVMTLVETSVERKSVPVRIGVMTMADLREPVKGSKYWFCSQQGLVPFPAVGFSDQVAKSLSDRRIFADVLLIPKQKAEAFDHNAIIKFAEQYGVDYVVIGCITDGAYNADANGHLIWVSLPSIVGAIPLAVCSAFTAIGSAISDDFPVRTFAWGHLFVPAATMEATPSMMFEIVRVLDKTPMGQVSVSYHVQDDVVVPIGYTWDAKAASIFNKDSRAMANDISALVAECVIKDVTLTSRGPARKGAQTTLQGDKRLSIEKNQKIETTASETKKLVGERERNGAELRRKSADKAKLFADEVNASTDAKVVYEVAERSSSQAVEAFVKSDYPAASNLWTGAAYAFLEARKQALAIQEVRKKEVNKQKPIALGQEPLLFGGTPIGEGLSPCALVGACFRGPQTAVPSEPLPPIIMGPAPDASAGTVPPMISPRSND